MLFSISHISLTVLMLLLQNELIKTGELRCLRYLFPNRHESEIFSLSFLLKTLLNFIHDEMHF